MRNDGELPKKRMTYPKHQESDVSETPTAGYSVSQLRFPTHDDVLPIIDRTFEYVDDFKVRSQHRPYVRLLSDKCDTILVVCCGKMSMALNDEIMPPLTHAVCGIVQFFWRDLNHFGRFSPQFAPA